MFLRPNYRSKDGKHHTYWSLVETVRTPDGPRQKPLCYLGELNSSAQARCCTSLVPVSPTASSFLPNVV
jgi:hypothetical protein